MRKYICFIALLLLAGVLTSKSADEFFVKTIEKYTNSQSTVVLGSEFANPKVLDSVYVYIQDTETSGAFTNLCSLKYGLSTNGVGTEIGTSSQSVHTAFITNLNLKVKEGDVLFLTNSMLRTSMRLFFK
jgi:hypothetical protein